MTSDCMVIERIARNGIIRISFGGNTERYLGYSQRDAEAKFRDEHGLKGKRIQKVCTNSD